LKGVIGYAVDMTRRRLILAVALATLVLSAGWWYYAERLSAEERLLVGVWSHRVGPSALFPGGGTVVMEFDSRRTYTTRAYITSTGQPLRERDGREVVYIGHWNVQDGRLHETVEEGFLDRIRYLIPAGFPGSRRGWPDLLIEWSSADEFTVGYPGASRDVWTRGKPE
jgi:hypothetical protein